ncbi:MAG: ATP12 family protein [Pseudomonadota bacterium]
MSEWAQKRFWKDVSLGEADGGFQVLLDGRGVRTPAKAAQIIPTRALAEAVAAEWDAQVETVDPGAMPLTRLTNSAIDKVTVQFSEVADSLAAYGGSDLLCYRASTPAELVARQGAAWDPLLAWAADTLAAPLETATGVMFVSQPEASLKALSDRVHGLTPFELAAFHDLVALSGSLVMAFAAIEKQAAPEEAWSWSRIDEDWQAEQWGEDEEAAEVAAIKRGEFLLAHRTFELVRDPT